MAASADLNDMRGKREKKAWREGRQKIFSNICCIGYSGKVARPLGRVLFVNQLKVFDSFLRADMKFLHTN
jgi:hypothetical protein